MIDSSDDFKSCLKASKILIKIIIKNVGGVKLVIYLWGQKIVINLSYFKFSAVIFKILKYIRAPMLNGCLYYNILINRQLKINTPIYNVYIRSPR